MIHKQKRTSDSTPINPDTCLVTILSMWFSNGLWVRLSSGLICLIFFPGIFVYGQGYELNGFITYGFFDQSEEGSAEIENQKPQAFDAWYQEGEWRIRLQDRKVVGAYVDIGYRNGDIFYYRALNDSHVDIGETAPRGYGSVFSEYAPGANLGPYSNVVWCVWLGVASQSYFSSIEPRHVDSFVWRTFGGSENLYRLDVEFSERSPRLPKSIKAYSRSQSEEDESGGFLRWEFLRKEVTQIDHFVMPKMWKYREYEKNGSGMKVTVQIGEYKILNEESPDLKPKLPPTPVVITDYRFSGHEPPLWRIQYRLSEGNWQDTDGVIPQNEYRRRVRVSQISSQSDESLNRFIWIGAGILVAILPVFIMYWNGKN